MVKEQQAANFPPGLGNPALRALAHANISGLEDLTQITEKKVAHLHGIGPSAIKKLRTALEEKGLAYAVKGE